ncbi:MAG: transcriptional regulator [Chromatiales bacterium]|jgi:DNA-binding transcriptional ArsR family regulator
MVRLDNPQYGDYSPHIGDFGGIDMQVASIGDALFTKTQQRVLALLYGKPDRSFYTNEILRWAAMGRGTISRELERLANAGLLLVRREGNQRHYQANPDNPVYGELLAIVRKTFGVAEVIRQALEPLAGQIELAFVYGSMAKANDTQASDIDLMLIGRDLQYGEVMDLLLPLEESLQRSIHPTLYDVADFQAKLKAGNSFLVRVMEQPRLMIQGGVDDFGKSAAHKAAQGGGAGPM